MWPAQNDDDDQAESSGTTHIIVEQSNQLMEMLSNHNSGAHNTGTFY